MNSHYFTDNGGNGANSTNSNSERTLTLHFKGAELRFLTSDGMFSVNEADPYSLLLMQHVKPAAGAGEKLLDLGCGWGLIGVTIGKLYDIDVSMSDVNGLALEYARKNGAANGVSARYFKSDGFSEINEHFDIITLNPPIHAGKEICYRLYEEAAAHLLPGGRFLIVISDKHGAKSHVKKLHELFGTVEALYRQNGLNIFECKN
jgi:16S rRNA (guanine1207-N2)-methyltransferase